MRAGPFDRHRRGFRQGRSPAGCGERAARVSAPSPRRSPMQRWSKPLGYLLAAGLQAAVLLPADAFAQSAPRKAGRGLAALTCGFLEIPGNVVQETRSRGAGWGFTLGFAEGLGKTVVRELVGA